MELSDKELLEAISQKEETSFNAFYDRYYRLLYEWAYRRTCDLNLTDEITQNFWITIWEDPEIIKTDKSGSANKFLLHHFTYRMLDFLKSSYVKTLSESNRKSFEELENELSYTHISEEYEMKDLESVINGILKDLPEQMAQIFMFQYREGYTAKETAEKLSINERTVKYKSKQCIDLLRKSLTKSGIKEDATSFKIIKNTTTSIIYIIIIADKIL